MGWNKLNIKDDADMRICANVSSYTVMIVINDMRYVM
jgi:hypothetical protein